MTFVAFVTFLVLTKKLVHMFAGSFLTAVIASLKFSLEQKMLILTWHKRYFYRPYNLRFLSEKLLEIIVIGHFYRVC